MAKETSQNRIGSINDMLQGQIESIEFKTKDGNTHSFLNLTIQEKEGFHIFIAKVRDYFSEIM